MNTVNCSWNDGVLTISLEGHLDSGNAMEVEQSINDFKDGKEISSVVVDCEKLSYISSAGLRIILRLKKQYEDTRLINVSNDVYEILSVTGFTEMLPVKKAFRTISVEGCKVIGKGANGIVYRISDDTIVKMYHNPDSLAEIDHERDLARTAFIMGIPTAIPFDIVKVEGGGFGSVFELLNASSFAEAIINNQYTIDQLAKESIHLLKQIHATEVKPGSVPSMRDIALNWVGFMKDHLPEDEFNKLYGLVEAVPEDYHMIHGDYHIKNIMIQNGESMLIDMDTLCHGHPIFEFASMFNSRDGFYQIDRNDCYEFYGVPYEKVAELWDKELHLYFEGRSDEEIQEIVEKASIVGFTRIMRRTIRRDGYNDEKGRAIINNCHENLTRLLAKYDTLLY